MQHGFYQFLKRHGLVLLILILLPIAFIALLKLDKNMSPTSSDWIEVFGAILAYIGTTAVSAVALYQSERANQLSEKVYELSERMYFVNFYIEDITQITACKCNCYDDADHSRVTSEKLYFCFIDSTPEQCHGYRISIRNCGDHPITQLKVSTTYPVGRNRIPETLERELETLIPPKGVHEYVLCNSPRFNSDCGNVVFKVTCKNMFGYFATVELKIHESDQSQPLSSSCRILEENKE